MFIYLFLVVGSAAAILLVSHWVGRRPLTVEKDTPYECGMPPIEKAHTQHPVRFYKVALLFVIFDVEALYLFAWSVSVRESGWVGFIEATIFITLLLVGLIYLWRIGALDWAPKKRVLTDKKPD